MNRMPRHNESPVRFLASTDRAVVTRAYHDDQPLVARQRLYDHQRPRYDLPGMVLDQVGDREGVWLDVGCGNGKYLHRIRAERPQVRAVGLDLSTTMFTTPTRPAVCADAARLPVRTGSAQVVLGMHMLYHLADPDQALAGMARALESEGVLVVSTNAHSDKAELDEWWARAAADVLGTTAGPRRVKLSASFPAEEAADRVATHFAEVKVIDLDGTIEVDTPVPILKHYASYRAWSHQVHVPFDQTLSRVDHLLRQELEDGPLRITTHQKMVIARHPRPAQTLAGGSGGRSKT